MKDVFLSKTYGHQAAVYLLNETSAERRLRGGSMHSVEKFRGTKLRIFLADQPARFSPAGEPGCIIPSAGSAWDERCTRKEKRKRERERRETLDLTLNIISHRHESFTRPQCRLHGTMEKQLNDELE